MRLLKAVGALALLLAGLSGASGAAAQDLAVKRLAFPVAGDLDYSLSQSWAYDPAGGRVLFGSGVHDARGLYATSDVGKSWTRIDDGSYQGNMGRSDWMNWLVPGPTRGSLYSLARWSPLLHSLDAGRTWQPIEMKEVSREIERLLLVPGDAKAFYLVTDEEFHPDVPVTTPEFLRLWYSPDGGRTVQQIGEFSKQRFVAVNDIGFIGRSLCVALWENGHKTPTGALRCQEVRGGPWRDLVIDDVTDKSRSPLVTRFWTERSGAIAVLASDALYISDDVGRSFKRHPIPALAAWWAFLHPGDGYPAYLSQTDRGGPTTLHRLDADHTIKKLGTLEGVLRVVDFARHAGIAENLTTDKGRYYRVELP